MNTRWWMLLILGGSLGVVNGQVADGPKAGLRPHKDSDRPGTPRIEVRPKALVVHIAPHDSATATVRIDTPKEIEYYRHGGILQYVLRRLSSGD